MAAKPATERTPLVVTGASEGYATVEPASPAPALGGATPGALSPAKAKEATAIKCAMAFCMCFMVVEIVGGYIAHSLAILTDAAHLLTDVGAFAMALFSIHATTRVSCHTYSYGWHRAEVVGTLASVFTIWVLVGGIVYEALNRIVSMYQCAYLPSVKVGVVDHSPEDTALFAALGVHSQHDRAIADAAARQLRLDSCQGVEAPKMVLIGCLGLTVNLACAAILSWGGSHGHSHHGIGGGHGHGCADDDDEGKEAAGSHGHSHGGDSAHGHSHGGESAHGHSHGSEASSKGLALNAAFLHAISDSIQSCGVIAAGLFNNLFQFLCTDLFSGYVLVDAIDNITAAYYFELRSLTLLRIQSILPL